MKRKEAIKKLQNGEIQICNDLLPSTKEIKKLLEKAFPEDEYLMDQPNGIDIQEIYFKMFSETNWTSSGSMFYDTIVVNLSEISKSKNKKKQIEKQLSELAKEVAEIKTLLSQNPLQEPVKTFEPDFENVKEENVSGWYKDEKNPKWIMYFDYENEMYYGFDVLGNWHTAKAYYVMRSKRSGESMCNPQEVEQALIAEAKKIYKNVNIVFDNWSKCKLKIDNLERFDYQHKTLFVLMNNNSKICLFNKGVWAEIIEEKPTKEEESIDWDIPQLLEAISAKTVFLTTGRHNETEFTAMEYVNKKYLLEENQYSKGYFRKFKGTLTINQE